MTTVSEKTAYIRDDGKGGFLVGTSKKPDDRHPDGYEGPVARVSFDKTWLYVNTDDYEGHAMMNIETLPMLRRALAKIAKRIKEQSR